MMQKLALVLLGILILVPGIAAGGCTYVTGQAPVIAKTTTPEAAYLTPEQAFTFYMVSSYIITIIDVRTPAEYAAGHLDGAINIDLRSPDFNANIDRLDRYAVYLVYCHTGNRAQQAGIIMEQYLFQHVYRVMEGGFAELAAQGFPVK